MSASNERIAWVDVFRFLGIWAIYIGHFGDKAGRAYPFVFAYHVPMFFFAAGFFSIRHLQEAPLAFLKKKTLQLMVPYAFFSVVALIVFSLLNNWDILQAKDASLSVMLGIRNQMFAGSLWFIPCLYIIIIGDYFVMRLFKSQALALTVAAGAFLVSQTLLPNNPARDPSWFMNLDSALFYYVYYSLGALTFPLVNKEPATTMQRLTMTMLIGMAFMVTALAFFQGPHWLLGKITTQLPVLSTFKLSAAIFDLFSALTIIYLNIAAAKLSAHIAFLGELGRETLIFCGTEDITKVILTQLLAMLNLKVRLNNPLVTIAFALICLLVSKFTIVGFLNTYFPWAVGKTRPTLIKDME